MIEHALKTATPMFDKSIEDGIKFRIYKIGSLEIRTTQKPSGEEIIGAVFSIKVPTEACQQQDRSAIEREQVLKATEYVERAPTCSGHQFYVVLETEQGNVIVSAGLEDGTMVFQENPKDLEDRNSLAKVIRSADCSNASITVKDMEDGTVTWQEM